MRRRTGGSCSCCCQIKEQLRALWNRASGCIVSIMGITPDGDGKFNLQAGTNIKLTEISNGVRIDTTGGVSYYENTDGYLDIDNDTLTINVVEGITGGLASYDDLATVAGEVLDIVNGNTVVPEATHASSADSATTAGSATNATNATNAQYLGSSSENVGNDTKPVKIVNGQAVEVANALQTELIPEVVTGYTPTSDAGTTFNSTFSSVSRYGKIVLINFGGCRFINTSGQVRTYLSGLPKAKNRSLALIYDGSLTVIGYIMIGDGATYATYTTSQAVTTDSALGQMVYITE